MFVYVCFVAAIFRSLLYEACGRIVNPIYGSVGLLWSGSWQLCQAAVEAVLKGQPITPINSEAAAIGQGPPLKAYDIRHVSKDENSAASVDRVKTRCRVKRVVKPKASKAEQVKSADEPVRCVEAKCYAEEMNRSTSHESSLSHQSEVAIVENESKDSESMVSVETAEAASLLFRADPESNARPDDRVAQDCCGGEIGLGLELTLGIEPVASRVNHVVPVKKRKVEAFGTCEGDTCKVELGLDYPARVQ